MRTSTLRIIVLPALLLLVLLAGLPRSASAASFAIARDTETEQLLHEFAAPILHEAGFAPDAITLHLVSSNAINAFVTGGTHMFINSGLIIKAEYPGEIIGVIAHETGHLTGGHLTRGSDVARNAGKVGLLGTLAGIATMALGNPDVGVAIMQGSQHVATQSFLQYSRGQEAAADQAAITLLELTEQSSRGLVTFMSKLQKAEAFQSFNPNPYVRSHPLGRERVAAMVTRAEASPFYNSVDSPALHHKLRRVQAKLIGFTHPVDVVLSTYPDDDLSIYGRYARAIAYHRNLKFGNAIDEIDKLLAAAPGDPHFLELKGQILVETGKVWEAVEPHAGAVRAAPNEPLLRIGLASAQIATEDPVLIKDAIRNLQIALRQDSGLPFGWQQLAVAYDRDGQSGMAALAAAERFLGLGNRGDAIRFAKKAAAELGKDSPYWLRAMDIQNYARGGRPAGEEKNINLEDGSHGH